MELKEEIKKAKKLIEDNFAEHPLLTIGVAFAAGALLAQPFALRWLTRMAVGGAFMQWPNEILKIVQGKLEPTAGADEPRPRTTEGSAYHH